MDSSVVRKTIAGLALAAFASCNALAAGDATLQDLGTRERERIRLNDIGSELARRFEHGRSHGA